METKGTKESSGKLKDSCDACSTFKLRCDKQKPICTRCKNLNRPCTYSPARRAGRPHAVRRESGQNQNQKGRKVQSRGGSDALQCFPAAESLTQSCATDTLMINPTATSERTDCLNSFNDGRFQALNYHAESRPNEIVSLPCAYLKTEPLDSDANKTDCTGVGLSIIEQLESSKRWSGSTATTSIGSIITEACQRLLTILVCPCSEQVEVALLVASACLSLMDLVHDDVEGREGSPTLTLVELGLSEQNHLIWPRSESFVRSLSCDSQSQVGDLFKIAKVIAGYADKYCQDTTVGPRWQHTGWVIAPVAALLRRRLQSVTQGATRRLVS